MTRSEINGNTTIAGDFSSRILRVGCASPKVRTGNIAANRDEILNQIKQAEEKGVSLLFFPEMALTGCEAKDILLNPAVLSACEDALDSICSALEDSPMTVIIGVILRERGILTKKFAVIQHGCIVTYLTDSSLVKDQQLYFAEDGREGDLLVTSGGLEISISTLPGADIQLMSSCENPTIGYSAYIQRKIGCLTGENRNVLLFTAENGTMAIGECGNMAAFSEAFDGCDLIVYDADMDIVTHERMRASRDGLLNEEACFSGDELEYEAFLMNDLETWDGVSPLMRDVSMSPFLPDAKEARDRNLSEIFRLQAHNLAARLDDTYSKVSVVGISGGLDSTLALLVTAYAHSLTGRKPEDIIAITMPGFGTTDRTYDNAISLIKSTGATFREIPIRDAVIQHFSDIGHDISDHSVTYENSQARERTQILMDVANKFGGIVIGTGDLSEEALGWCTYNGDHMAMYNVNSCVPKTVVRETVRWFITEELPQVDYIPEPSLMAESLADIIDTPISPELLPPDEAGNMTQCTEDKVGPYMLHDFFIYHTIRSGASPEKLTRLAVQAFSGIYDENFIRKWQEVFYRRFFTQQFKRNCAPDGVSVGGVDLGYSSWKMSSTTSYAPWLEKMGL